ncbi:hypothetical protein HY339_00550 [Candidatus Gottesmanbacteria bacterium]|nr:hypothetical protein [Candidatus Gottesmanbacteria bacterium]
MKITKRDAVRIAISYADIFDYPLTEEEVRVWAPYVSIRSLLAVLQGVTLKNKRLLAIRKQREEWSREKWIRARLVAKLLKIIPTITLVGVTGGLTRFNVRQEDDIDFLIITAPKTLWVTRALTTILLDIFHLRRRPGDREFQNLICLNMFMGEDGLAVARGERDLFTAHEVLLMKPLWERDGAYRKFLSANRWVRRFLPTAWEEKSKADAGVAVAPQHDVILASESSSASRISSCLGFVIWSLRFFEPLVRILQLWYMKKRRSTEIVTDTVIRFHPRDARVWIKRALGRRLARFNIPLDKIFYGR